MSSATAMMEKESDDGDGGKDVKSKTISAPATATATTAVVTRIQPLRASKMQQPALVTGKAPESTKKTEETFQRERVKKFGYTFGVRFNSIIVAWQNDSKTIRQFFLDGSIGKLIYAGPVLKWNADMSALALDRFRQEPDKYDQLLDLDAFWNVMTKGQLDTFKSDTTLYRGVRLYPGEQLPNIGYAVQNVLTNWSSHPITATNFVNVATGALYAAVFPKGTRYFYTGDGEFEYIIPGGMFQLRKYPQLATFPPQLASEMEVTLLDFAYLPGSDGQFFPWPSKSPSPSTRATYQREVETYVLPDLVESHLTVTQTTTLPQIVQQFETLKKRTGYTGKNTLTDYETAFYDLLDRTKPPHAKTLLKEYETMLEVANAANAAEMNKSTALSINFMDFKVGGGKDAGRSSGFYLGLNGTILAPPTSLKRGSKTHMRAVNGRLKFHQG